MSILSLLRGRKETPTPVDSEFDDTDAHPIGCEVLHDGSSVVADVVFVHGLRGHQTRTWSSQSGVCWPKDLLPNEEGFAYVRILSFGYDANVVNFVDATSRNSIFEHALSLLNELVRKRKKNLQRPLVFVAHSLGGLVVKEALHSSHMEADTLPDLASVLKATTGIVFLGTPHRGADKAAWGNVMKAIARVALRDTNDNLLRELERNSPALDRIGTDFSKILAKRTFKIFSFTEELPMSNVRGVGKIVENDSAVIGDAYERRQSIHANHIGMVKFGSTRTPGYGPVVAAIRDVLPELPEDTQEELESLQ